MADDAERLIVLLEARIRDFEKNMQKASGTAGQSYDKMRKGSKSATSAMESDMIRSTTRINQALATGATKIGSYSKAFSVGIIGGFTAALAPMALFQAALDEIGNASALVRLSERLGLTTTQIQVLQKEAELVGVKADTMADGIGDFAAKVAEASAKAGPLYEIFKANNVELRKADGTLRSTRELLAEYAELIKNAGSEQEALFLAQQAFGDEAAKMVPLFKKGAAGIADMERAAVEAGNVVDEELLRRAADLDKRWQEMWSNFGTFSKSAILGAVSYLSQLSGALGEINAKYQQRLNVVEAGKLVGSLAGTTGGGGEQTSDPDTRIAQAFSGEIQKADDKLIAALQERYNGAATRASKTILPAGDKGGGAKAGRNSELAKAEREAKRVLEYIEALREERSLIGATNVEREKANALRRAGSAATAEQREEIGLLVEAIYREEEGLKAAKEAANFFKDAMTDAFMALIPTIETGNAALDRFLNTLIEVVAQAALAGTGPLAGLFGGSLLGGSGGGLLGGLFGGLGFATGTANTGGQRGKPRGIVHGQEAVIPLPSGGRVPVMIQGGGSVGGNAAVAQRVDVYVHSNDEKLRVFVQQEADGRILEATPQIVGTAVSQSRTTVIPTMAAYQQQKAGGNYRG